MTQQYIRSKHLQIESRTDGKWVIVHSLLGTRLEINRAGYRFLQLFERSMSLEELAKFGSLEKALPLVERFRRCHFLVETGQQETMASKVVQRTIPHFFNCPPVPPIATPSDVTFLGVPFDYGNTAEPGARYGPKSIRDASAAAYHYTLDFDKQAPRGWYDNSFDRQILRDITMGDAGDVFIFPGESPQLIFNKITTSVAEILRRGSFPVIIGGDHSITYPVLAAYGEDINIIHFDAHSDLAAFYPDVENHHGNVMSRVLRLPHVKNFYQIGLRGVTPYREGLTGPQGALRVSAQQLRQLGVEQVMKQIPPEGKYYVTVDIDALDPGVAPATSTPKPGGLGFEEAREMLWAIGMQRQCVGFDLVEVNPKLDVNGVTSIVSIELILSFLGAHFEGRHERNK